MKTQIFLCRLPEAVSPELADTWQQALPPFRREKSLACRCADAALASAAAYALLAYALDKTGASPTPPVFAYTPQGKPYLASGAIQFSLSHTHGCAACTVSDEAVGVDVQAYRPVQEALTRRVLSEAEYAVYKTHPAPEDYFFQQWTLRESYMKYTGRGLSEGLRSLIFTESDGICRLQGHDKVFFFTDRPIARYALACCSRTPVTEPPVFCEANALLSYLQSFNTSR